MNAAQALELSVALTELRKYIERDREIGKGTDTYISVTGEPYIILSPHIVAEGERSPVFKTLDDLMVAARAGFDSYAKGRAGSLYWRCFPEAAYIHATIHDHESGWKCFSRLLISDKPAKES